MSLTDLRCRNSKSQDKPYKMFDGEGLYLEVMQSGSKIWRLKYRLHGKEKRVTVGKYPDLGLAEARKEKGRIKEELSQGIDPVLVRIETKQMASFQYSQSFEAIAKEWFEKNAPAWKDRYAQTIMHRLEKYIFPHLGNFPITQIKPLTILVCLQQIEKTAPEMARRAKQYISHIFKYAIATSRAEFDYTYGLEAALKKYRRGHFASLDIDALPEFLQSLEKYQWRLNRQTFLAIKMMLLTFVRTQELIEAKWEEFDFENKIWIIPAERMKGKRSHIVPLATQTISILSELTEMNFKSKYVFPSIPCPRKRMSKGTILVALKRMGYSGKMTGHGFRALALGILKEKLGYSHEVADRQLGHVPKSGVDRAYDRAKFLPQRTEMMQRYADYITSVSADSTNRYADSLGL